MDSLLIENNNAEWDQTKEHSSDKCKDSDRLKENFLLVEYISKGYYGQVYKVQEKSTNSFYAMKIMKKKGEVATLEMEREKDIISNLKSYPFLADFHSLYDTQYHIAIVMEYLDGFPMTDYLAQLDYARLEEKNAAFYLAEISLAVHFLHKNGIIHRDIKLSNIMMNGDGHVKLIDFGISKSSLGFGDTTRTCVGLSDNGAPEYFKGLPYTFSLDWYAVGLALYIMLIGDHPFQRFLNYGSKANEIDMLSAMEAKQFDYETNILSNEAISILDGLLEPDPKKRLGNKDSNEYMEIGEHAFLKDIDWIRIEKKEIKPPYIPKYEN